MNCFKSYDIRGKIPEELNAEIAYRIGRAYAEYINPKTVCVGKDIRHHSPEICGALSEGLTDGGADVYDLGLCGTEEVYFAVSNLSLDGGIMVTASHNPLDYNGMKLVREKSRPVSGDTGLNTIKEMVLKNSFAPIQNKGKVIQKQDKSDYIRFILKYTDVQALKGMRIVLNPGNGCAGPVADLLEKELPCEFIKIFNEPDGTFPNGIPNPLLPENRSATSEAVLKHSADMGVAWDGDFDRCFLFDEKGDFIEGYYIVALLAEALLKNCPGEKIIHDPRLTWNTIDIVKRSGGIPIMSKTGHAYIKERMRAENAVYGGEMSAHHYFRDFAYCDSGMIPWLLAAGLVASKKMKLSCMVEAMIKQYPVSGELNISISDPQQAIKQIEDIYAAQALMTDRTDGISMEFENWRFNLRMSNTEPLVRLNVETRADSALMEQKRDELMNLLKSRA